MNFYMEVLLKKRIQTSTTISIATKLKLWLYFNVNDFIFRKTCREFEKGFATQDSSVKCVK